MKTKFLDIKRVLFVDDNPSFLNMIEKVFGLWSKGSWEILKVDSIDQVLPMMEQKRIHLVVIDVYVPGKDGVAFLRKLHKHFPAIPKVVLTEDDVVAADRDECLQNGALRYLHKPGTMEQMEKIFKTLDAFAKEQPDGGFRGEIWVTSLQEVLQIEGLNRSSSVLEFNAGRYEGKVFMKNGAVIHAEAAHFTGTMALGFLLALKGGEFRLKPFTPPPAITIHGSLEMLLLEAAHHHDQHAGDFFTSIQEHGPVLSER